MNQLTDAQTLTLRRMLDELESSLQSALHQQVARLCRGNAPGLTQASGAMADPAAGEPDDEQATAVARAIRAVQQIEAARSRLAAGSFGICIDCGSAIDVACLLVDPTAARCPGCQGAYGQTRQAAADEARPDPP